MGNGGVTRGALAVRFIRAKSSATSQYGLISVPQLKAHGLNGVARSRLASVGSITWVVENVYKFREGGDEVRQRVLAGCLSVAGYAAFRTAGQLHGLDGCGSAKSKRPVDIVAKRKARPREGYAITRRKTLQTEEVTTRHNVPVTTIHRTLMDLADVLTEQDFAFAFESAWRLGLINPKEWRKRLRKEGRTLSVAMRRMLNDSRLRSKPMQSPLEVRIWRGLRAKKMKLPVVQYGFADDYGHPLAPDFCFPSRRLIVEAIGYEAHGGNRAKFEADAIREARLVAAGFSVLRVTSQMLDEDEAGVMNCIRRALEARHVRRFKRVVHESFVADFNGAQGAGG